MTPGRIFVNGLPKGKAQFACCQDVFVEGISINTYVAELLLKVGL